VLSCCVDGCQVVVKWWVGIVPHFICLHTRIQVIVVPWVTKVYGICSPSAVVCLPDGIA
jgi:hypothetical protein